MRENQEAQFENIAKPIEPEQKEKIEFSSSFNSETRKELYPEISREDWENPQWQFKNTLKSFNPENQKTVAEFVQKIRDIFQDKLPEEQIIPIEKAAKQRKIGITPYEICLMKLNEQGYPESTDPIYRQFLAVEGDDDPDFLPKEFASNWERAEESIAGIAHHKYPDRVIVRLCFTCPATCSFCFERRNVL